MSLWIGMLFGCVTSVACAFWEEVDSRPVVSPGVSFYAQPFPEDSGMELPSPPLALLDIQPLSDPDMELPPLLGHGGTAESFNWAEIEAAFFSFGGSIDAAAAIPAAASGDVAQSATLPEKTLRRKKRGTGRSSPDPKPSKRTPLQVIQSLEDDPVYGCFYGAYQGAIAAIESSPLFQTLQYESELIRNKKAPLRAKKREFGLTAGDVAEVSRLDKELALLRQERFQLKNKVVRSIFSHYLAAREGDRQEYSDTSSV